MNSLLPHIQLKTSEYNDTLDISPLYCWKTSPEIELAQRRLSLANLIFTVEVEAASTGPIFETINTAFLSHCAKNKIDFVAPASVSLYTTPNTMPWVLLGPKGRTNRSWVEDPKFLTAFTFTLPALRASPYNTTPNYLAEGLFIFIGEPLSVAAALALWLFCVKLRDCGTCIHLSTAFFNLPPGVQLMF